jgi:hypothetical protein
MANIRLAAATRNSMLNPLVTLLNGGTLEFYTGTQPATGDTALSGNTLLGTLTFNATSGTVASGTLTLNAVTQDSAADATGTATFARMKTSGAVVVGDVDVGTSGASINMNTTSIVTGGPISITSGTISIPA